MKYFLSIMNLIIFCFLCTFFASLSGKDAEEGFIGIEGGRLFYRVIGEGEPVFIIHGGPGMDHTYLVSGMDTLYDSNRLVYYDQRGSGKSDAELNCESINMDNFVQDLEKLRKAFKYEKIALIGHSWGGLVAMEYALKYPSYVKALILMNSTPASTKGVERFYENLDLRLKPISDKLATIESSTDFNLRNPEAISNYLHLILQKYFWDEKKCKLLPKTICRQTAANFATIGGLLENDYLSDFDIREAIKKIACPTLVVHGDCDPIPEKYADEIHQGIKGSQYFLIARCGHFPFIEQPYALFRMIKSFLKNN